MSRANGSSEENSDQEQGLLQKSQVSSQSLNIQTSQQDQQIIPIKKQDSNFVISKQLSSISVSENQNNSKSPSSSSTIQFQYSPSKQEVSNNSLEEQKQQQSGQQQRFQFQFNQDESQNSINNDVFNNERKQIPFQQFSYGSFISDQNNNKQQTQEPSQQQFTMNDNQFQQPQSQEQSIKLFKLNENEFQQEINTKRSESSASNDQVQTPRENGYVQFQELKSIVPNPENLPFDKYQSRHNSSVSDSRQQLRNQGLYVTQSKEGLKINISTEELKKLINISKESISKKERKIDIAPAVGQLQDKLVRFNIERDNCSNYLIL